jgi:hypothetical protein
MKNKFALPWGQVINNSSHQKRWHLGSGSTRNCSDQCFIREFSSIRLLDISRRAVHLSVTSRLENTQVVSDIVLDQLCGVFHWTCVRRCVGALKSFLNRKRSMGQISNFNSVLLDRHNIHRLSPILVMRYWTTQFYPSKTGSDFQEVTLIWIIVPFVSCEEFT